MVLRLRDLTDGRDVERCLLVDVVIQPVHKQERRTRAPAHMRSLGRIVVREIVLRDLDRKSLIEISEILIPQRIDIVLGVSRDEELPSVKI